MKLRRWEIYDVSTGRSITRCSPFWTRFGAWTYLGRNSHYSIRRRRA